jgi:uncharacterized MnhB-related membrane protein
MIRAEGPKFIVLMYIVFRESYDAVVRRQVFGLCAVVLEDNKTCD